MQALCCLDVQGQGVSGLVDQFIDDSRQSEQTIQYARKLLEMTLADRDECDEILSRHAKHWQLPRLALVDRNILRLAVAEMKSDAPYKVVISEAVRLAQEFSTAESAGFVNGVLDAVAKEIVTKIGNRQ